MENEEEIDLILINHLPEYTGIGRYVKNVAEHVEGRYQIINVIFNSYLSGPFSVGEIVSGSGSLVANVFLRKFVYRKLRQKLEHLKASGGHIHYAESAMPRLTKSTDREIVTFHDIFPLEEERDALDFKQSLYRRYTKTFLEYKNAIAISETTKTSVLEAGFTGDIEVIYDMVNPIFKPPFDKNILRQKYSIDSDKRNIISVSTDDKRKNLSLLRNIIEKIGSEFSLTRVGPSIGKGKTFVEVGEQELVELYQAADVFLLTSVREGFNFPVVEAMACGLPVVVSDIPIMREIVGNAGLLCDLNDPDSFVEGIYEATDNFSYYSPKSIQRSEKFSFQIFKERMETYYDRL